MAKNQAPGQISSNPGARTRLVTIRGIPMEINRRAVRVLRITVYPDCRVRVTAPQSATSESLGAFIDSKFPWLEKHLARCRERARKKPLAQNRFTGGEIHYVWGIPHALKVIERRGNPKIAVAAGEDFRILEMYLRPGSTAAQKQALLDRWRKALVAKAAPALAAKWGKSLKAAGGKKNFTVEKIYLQKMKTHWGSCNPARRNIRLNTELAAKDPACLDYVVLHEMIHFITRFHNRIFYDYMNALMPGWKEIRKKMNRGEDICPEKK
ncbi:MAG: M48 family metallopeptidase [Spirochaetaceae bacterium]|nr:M48 family metallopeptidase [Spirochaetaceae bacterium]